MQDLKTIAGILAREIEVQLTHGCEPCAHESVRRAFMELATSPLDILWVDVPAFSGAQMANLSKAFHDQGIEPTLRNLLSMPEIKLQTLASSVRMRRETMDLITLAREPDSRWSKMLEDEAYDTEETLTVEELNMLAPTGAV